MISTPPRSRRQYGEEANFGEREKQRRLGQHDGRSRGRGMRGRWHNGLSGGAIQRPERERDRCGTRSDRCGPCVRTLGKRTLPKLAWAHSAKSAPPDRTALKRTGSAGAQVGWIQKSMRLSFRLHAGVAEWQTQGTQKRPGRKPATSFFSTYRAERSLDRRPRRVSSSVVNDRFSCPRVGEKGSFSTRAKGPLPKPGDFNARRS